MKKIYWDGASQSYLDYVANLDNAIRLRVEIAAEQLRTYINLDYVPLDCQLVIIKVGGYDCVALRGANLLPNLKGVEIYELVSPFDENRVYPIQCAELKLEFKLY